MVRLVIKFGIVFLLHVMNKVTVIMPAYNSSKTISKSIKCVLNQKYNNLELIVVCDAPTDNTEIIAKEFTDPRVKIVVLDDNQGVAEARNAGLKLALGRYIAFCDADDYWYPEKLSVQIDLRKQLNVSVCHANCHLVNVSGEIIGMRKYPMLVTYKMMKHRNYICNSSGIYDTKKLPVILNKNIYHEDYLMWLEILSPDGVSVGSKQPLLMYTVNPNSLSANKFKSVIGMLRVQRKHGLSRLQCCINLILNFFSRIFPSLIALTRN